MRHVIVWTVALTLAGATGAEAAAKTTTPPPRATSAKAAKPGAAKPGPEPPKEREYSYIYDIFDHSLVRPVTRWADPGLWVRKLTRNPREAANVDENDQVRLPSTWWQPRLGFRPVTVEQMLKGPGPGAGPAPGKWTVTKGKSQGVTPGFQFEDSKGDKFIVKFDPPGSPDLATAVDVIGSYLFWAAGYNVPENTIEYFRPADLELADDATYTDALGTKRPMTREVLDKLLKKATPLKDGRYRCMASRYLSGKPLGPFEYSGRRKDDPEDLVPHELRRELRGFWTVCAFVNHADSRGPNTLDTWVTENGRSFVRHHLIDFGSILGSSALGKRSYSTGTEYYVDFKVIGRQTATLGLKPFVWEDVVDPNIPSVGFVEGEVFDPDSWRPDYPNPAFDERTERDIRWGARIVSGFTDQHIRAAVAKGGYTDPRAAEYVAGVLIQRRDKIVRRWLGSETNRLLAAP